MDNVLILIGLCIVLVGSSFLTVDTVSGIRYDMSKKRWKAVIYESFFLLTVLVVWGIALLMILERKGVI